MFDTTSLMRFFALRRQTELARQDAILEQERQLLNLAATAADTRFGRDHDFAAIRTIADFQARVPLRTYEAMWNDYWKPSFPRLVDCSWPGRISYFALSSGTTSGTTKYIPCSDEILKRNGRAALDLMAHHLHNRPQSHVLGGKSFMLGGSTDLSEVAPGVFAGDLSGIAAARVPWWARTRIFPPPEIALIVDWEKKVDILARRSLDLDIRNIAGTPSWLLIFFERLFAHLPEREPKLKAFFPNLELVTHGGVNFARYAGRFAGLMEGCHAETREAYAASEGFIASADLGPGDGLRLMADNGLFFEFVPVEELSSPNPTRHWLKHAQSGVDYALTLSSCAGLFAYLIGDIVRFVSLKPPRILISGRTSHTLSVFGEHLTGREIDDAVLEAAHLTGTDVAEFTFGALMPEGTESRGGHCLIAAFVHSEPTPEQQSQFLARLDAALARRNDDYRAHRAGGFGLDAPTLLVVRPRMFEAWMKVRGQLGGQHKVPRVLADPEAFAALHRFAVSYRD